MKLKDTIIKILDASASNNLKAAMLESIFKSECLKKHIGKKIKSCDKLKELAKEKKSVIIISSGGLYNRQAAGWFINQSFQRVDYLLKNGRVREYLR